MIGTNEVVKPTHFRDTRFINIFYLKGDRDRLDRIFNELVNTQHYPNEYLFNISLGYSKLQPGMLEAIEAGNELAECLEIVLDDSVLPLLRLDAVAQLINAANHVSEYIHDVSIKAYFTGNLPNVLAYQAAQADIEKFAIEERTSMVRLLELIRKMNYQQTGYLLPRMPGHIDISAKNRHSVNALTESELVKYEQSYTWVDDNTLAFCIPSNDTLVEVLDEVHKLYNVDVYLLAANYSGTRLEYVIEDGVTLLKDKEPALEVVSDVLDSVGQLDAYLDWFGWTTEDLYPELSDGQYIATTPVGGID